MADLAKDSERVASGVDMIVALEASSTVRIAYWAVMLMWAGILIVFWFDADVGPGHPLYAMLLTIWTAVLTPGVAVPILKRLPHHWCRVSAGERIIHRTLGVSIFGWLLDRSGWNHRNVYPAWGYSITKTRLPVRVLAARGGMGAHGACFAVHVTVAALALSAGQPWGALWILLPGIVLHLYPVLLQRSIMLRLQPLLENSRRSSLLEN
jgi:hypothetical protein